MLSRMEDSTHIEREPRTALVFGGSGQIGERLVANLLSQGWTVTAVSRQPRTSVAGEAWLVADLFGAWQGPARFDVVFSCGPLDHFARWFASTSLECPRIVAFGSTSMEVKQDSIEPAERAVAHRMRQAETTLFVAASERGVAATLLRPTLIYGAGRDKTLTVIADIARRRGFCVLPFAANGLRQPVHVQDLADAAMQVVARPETFGKGYALGGGETLPYTTMVRRVLDALRPRPRLLRVPTSLFRWALHRAHAKGRLQGMSDATLARMCEPLAFDTAPARRDFGYAPRPFMVDAAMLGLADAPAGEASP